jgi:hypothetical protein
VPTPDQKRQFCTEFSADYYSGFWPSWLTRRRVTAGPDPAVCLVDRRVQPADDGEIGNAIMGDRSRPETAQIWQIAAIRVIAPAIYSGGDAPAVNLARALYRRR